MPHDGDSTPPRLSPPLAASIRPWHTPSSENLVGDRPAFDGSAVLSVQTTDPPPSSSSSGGLAAQLPGGSPTTTWRSSLADRLRRALPRALYGKGGRYQSVATSLSGGGDLQDSDTDLMTSFPEPDASLLHSAATAAVNSTFYSPRPSVSAPQNRQHRQAGTLGTAEGVFLPTWLSIWGIMLFLRLGYCVGQAGLWHTLCMFCIGYVLAFLTTLSIAAVSTNGVVKGGGPYYMISRSIGMEFGGCLGLLLLTMQVLSGALNVFGAIEPLMNHFGRSTGTVAMLLPQGPWWQFLYGSILLFICMLLCLLGSRGFARTSIVLFGILAFSTLMMLLSFMFQSGFEVAGVVRYTGLSSTTLRENLYPQYTAGHDFSRVFGIIYPACTGILAGASMSGDLRRPSKSIPTGTLYAVLVTFVSYLLFSFLIAATTSRETLVTNFTFLSNINFVPAFVMVGMYATAVFAIIGCIMTTSKILQALARDKIIPLLNIFGRGRLVDDEPVLAIILTWFLIQMCLFVGEINEIVPVITILTLLSYGIINLASFLLKVASAPNFRPTFVYFHWFTALLGFIACFVAMYVVSVSNAALATAFMLIHFNSTPKAWGDIHQALIYHQVRKYLLRLDARRTHVKFWRPQILFLLDDRPGHSQLIQFANALKKGSLYILAQVLPSADFNPEVHARYQEEKAAWMDYVDRLGIKSFTEVIVAPSVRVGGRIALANSGLGGMKPNILLLGWKRQSVDFTPYETSQLSLVDYIGLISDALTLDKSVAVARGMNFLHLPPARNPTAGRYLNDVWQWLRKLSGARRRQGQNTQARRFIDLYPLLLSNDYDTFAMVLQLGCVLHMVPEWSESNFGMRVMCVVERQADVSGETRRMQQLLEDLRIRATVVCISLETSGVLSKRASVDFMFHDDMVSAGGIQLGTRRMTNGSDSAQRHHSVSEFRALAPLEQARIINKIMHKCSPPSRTSVIFTSLPSPPDPADIYTQESSGLPSQPCMDYWQFMNRLSYGAGRAQESDAALGVDLPPMLMVHGKGTVLTTSL